MQSLVRVVLTLSILTYVATAYAAVTVSVNGSNHTIPQSGEKGWGTNVTAWIQAISANTLQPSGGNFTLTADTNFGPNYGLLSSYYKSRSSNVSSVGVLRLANTDTIGFRNAANGGNLLLGVDSSDRLTFNGSPYLPSAALTASRAVVSDAAGVISASAVTSTELGYLSGLTSAVQTQLDAKATTAALSSHEADTTAIHGITDSAALVTLTGSQTLTNKTLTSPAISTPTGLVKGDVGLGNVDNTSDATKNAASVTLTNKTLTAPVLTAPVIDSAGLTEQASSPAAPSAGTKKLYAKTDGKVYTLNSAGQEQQVGAGAGGSGKNYASDLFSGESVSGINRYDDGASATAVDGTGGTPSITAAALNTTTPLRGTSSQRLSKGAANEQGEGWSYDFTLDRADYEGSKNMIVSFRYKTSANYAANDVRLFVYDRDGLTLLNVLSLTNDGSLGIATDTTRFVASFNAVSTSNDYRLILHVTSTNAAAYDIDLIDLSISPEATVPGAIVADLGTETWTDSWTNATTSVKLLRVGNRVFAKGTVTVTGAGETNFDLTIPAAYTASSVYTFATSQVQSVGLATLYSSAPATFPGLISLNSATNLRIFSTNAGAVAGLTATAPFTWANGHKMTFEASWEVSGWQASAALSTTETLLMGAKVKATNTAGTSLLNATETDIPFATETEDNLAAYNGTTFTAPRTGSYTFTLNASIAGATAGTGNLAYFNLTNASNTQLAVLSATGLPLAGNNFFSGSATLKLSAGDQVKVRGYQANGATRTLSTTATHNLLQVTEQIDPTVFSVYGDSYAVASATKKEGLERVRIAPNCTASPCTMASNSAGVSSVTRSGVGLYSINFVSNAFSAAPVCVATADWTGGYTFAHVRNPTTTGVTVDTSNTANAAADSGFTAICMGPK